MTQTSNVLHATETFKKQRLKGSVQNAMAEMIEHLCVNNGLIGGYNAVALSQNALEAFDELPKDVAYHLGLRLSQCEPLLFSEPHIADDGMLLGVQGGLVLRYAPHRLLENKPEDLEAWEGDVLHVIQVEMDIDPYTPVVVDVVPWDDEGMFYVEGVLDDEDVCFDVRIPETEENMEGKATFAALYAQFFNHLTVNGFERALTTLVLDDKKPEPPPHIVHASRRDNQILFLVLDVAEMLRLENQFIDYMEFNNLA